MKNLHGTTRRRACAWASVTSVGWASGHGTVLPLDSVRANSHGNNIGWARVSMRWTSHSLTNMDGAKMTGAMRTGARMDGARVSGARMGGARVSGAKMGGARVSGASLI